MTFLLLTLLLLTALLSCGDEGKIDILGELTDTHLGELKWQQGATAPSTPIIFRPLPDELKQVLFKWDAEELKDLMRFHLSHDVNDDILNALVLEWATWLKQHEHYTRYVDVGGIPIIGSDKVSNDDFRIARGIVRDMTSKRTELREYLTPKPGFRFRLVIVYPGGEFLPEAISSPMFIKKAGGFCGTICTAFVGSGGLPKEWKTLIHEFAHGIHRGIERFGDPNFEIRLKEIYAEAMEAGLWVEHNAYAATNYKEYWAEGVKHWYIRRDHYLLFPDQQAERWEVELTNGLINKKDLFPTRQDFINYDPQLAALIAEWLPDIELTLE